MNPRSYWFLSLFLCLSVASAQAEGRALYYFQVDHRYDYRNELLALALSYTNGKAGHETIIPTPMENMPSARGQQLLKKNDFLGIVSLATNYQREEEFLPIRVPILAGALGMRIALIRDDHQHILDDVQTLQQLRKIKAGFVSHWGDMIILEKNGLEVLSAARYETMFAMLSAGRFEYFPRGINEIQQELEKFQRKYWQLAIEKNLAIYYPYPVYFFVHKEQQDIAQRIELGLKEALKDGSFKALFLAHHSQLFEDLNLKQRRIIVLENPTLPEGTEMPDMSWWLGKELNLTSKNRH